MSAVGGRKCSMYDLDREVLMDFGNEADDRAKEAETGVHDFGSGFGSIRNIQGPV